MPIDNVDFAFYLIVQWLQDSLEAFIGQVGSQKAVEILYPYYHFAGASADQWAIHEYKIKGNDLEQIASIMQEENIDMRKELAPYEITPFGARCDIIDCNFKNAIPQMCEVICTAATNGICSGISAEYHCLIPMKMTVGAPHCRWIITKKSTMTGSDGFRDKGLYAIPSKHVDKATRDKHGLMIFTACWIQQILAIIETLGTKKTMEILSPCMRSSGLSAGLRIEKSLDLHGQNAITISSVLDFFNGGMSQKGNNILYEPETVIKEIVDCSLAGSPPEIQVCFLMEQFTNSVCEAINPDYELLHTKAMCRGDKTCVRVIRKKMRSYSTTKK